jgi:hypothetical protein
MTEIKEISRETVDRILREGPNRVVINAEGEGVSPRRALEEFGVTPDITYIRNDGWSLGAPAAFARIAESMWQKEWIGMLLRTSSTALPYVPSRSLCDFCGAKLVEETYAYPASDFYISLLDFRSSGPWLACPACHRSIANGHWELVAEAFADRYLQENNGRREDGFALAATMHNVFRMHRLSTPVVRLEPRKDKPV